MPSNTDRKAMDWRYFRRRAVNIVNLSGSVFATVFGLIWLFWILWTTFSAGIAAFDMSLFQQDTPAPGSEGGLANAIIGSLIMVGLATVIGTPIGILAGTYLAEYGKKTRVAGFIRFINDILLSAPSIIIGLFVYEIVVIMLPVIIRTTEEMLRLVPNPLREAALALGAPRWKMISLVAYRAAMSGILTGILLSVARIAGETAPLLFTALNNQFWSTDLTQPMANLPVVIFQFAMSPYESWHALAWAGSLLITLSVLALSILARVFLRKARMEH
jgi:phosphate transport system permease protein